MDTTAPVITLLSNSNINHEAGSAYEDENATRTDAVDGEGVVLATGEVDTSTPGTYTLTYDYTDAAGNAAVQVTRTVLVGDTTPVISLNEDAVATHTRADAYYDDNATWTDIDRWNGSIFIREGDVNTMVPGTYILSFNYTDVAGTCSPEVNRTVQVVD